MFRLIPLIFTVLTSFCSCKSKTETPVLSGVLWGGEGNKIFIRPAFTAKNSADTLLIDNMGMFEWLPDTVIAGLYYVENIYGNKIILILDAAKPLFIDGLYATFPNHLKIKGTNLHELFLQVENTTKEWNNEIDLLAQFAEKLKKENRVNFMEIINYKHDSIKTVYREKIISISNEPLVRMGALLQSAGNNPLFNHWLDREFFYETAANLKQYTYLNEVKIFIEQTAKLQKMESHFAKINTGDQFPFMIIGADTISKEMNFGNIVYIEIRKPDTFLQTVDLMPYTKLGLKSIIINLNEKEEEFTVNQLGLMQFPSNFLLNKEGIVTAKNIWGAELKKALDIMMNSE